MYLLPGYYVGQLCTYINALISDYNNSPNTILEKENNIMPNFIDVVFPIVANNDYDGHPYVFWIFLVLTISSLARSLLHILKSDGGAESVATIPLKRFPIQGSIDLNFLPFFGYADM